MAEPRIRLAVLFGGRSGEHEVSCESAASILVGLDRERYEVLPVRIGRDGVWSSAPAMPELSTVEEVLRWQRNGFSGTGDTTPAGSILAAARELTRCAVVFPALHGPYGEDGAVQALLEFFDIPYVGSGVAAAALSMDKEYTKKIAASAGLAVAEDVVLRRGQHDVSPRDRDRLGLPVFVKPAREGSSIGVSKVRDWAELPHALDRARESDDKVLVEAAVPGREIDIGVLEHPCGDLRVSPPMEIRPSGGHTFFDYHAKYADSTTVFDVPAALDPATTHAIGRDALHLFRELGCSGLLRVDFFLRPDGILVLNEVNTFPGFTSVSQYPRMWQAAGLDYGDLLDILIDTALIHRRGRPSGEQPGDPERVPPGLDHGVLWGERVELRRADFAVAPLDHRAPEVGRSAGEVHGEVADLDARLGDLGLRRHHREVPLDGRARVVTDRGQCAVERPRGDPQLVPHETEPALHEHAVGLRGGVGDRGLVGRLGHPQVDARDDRERDLRDDLERGVDDAVGAVGGHPLVRDEHVLDHDVVAGGAAHPEGVPVVGDGDTR